MDMESVKGKHKVSSLELRSVHASKKTSCDIKERVRKSPRDYPLSV